MFAESTTTAPKVTDEDIEQVKSDMKTYSDKVRDEGGPTASPSGTQEFKWCIVNKGEADVVFTTDASIERRMQFIDLKWPSLQLRFKGRVPVPANAVYLDRYISECVERLHAKRAPTYRGDFRVDYVDVCGAGSQCIREDTECAEIVRGEEMKFVVGADLDYSNVMTYVGSFKRHYRALLALLIAMLVCFITTSSKTCMCASLLLIFAGMLCFLYTSVRNVFVCEGRVVDSKFFGPDMFRTLKRRFLVALLDRTPCNHSELNYCSPWSFLRGECDSKPPRILEASNPRRRGCVRPGCCLK